MWSIKVQLIFINYSAKKQILKNNNKKKEQEGLLKIWSDKKV